MDSFEGRCWLVWWANSSTNLGGVEAHITIISSDEGWKAHGQLIAASDDELEGFNFLCTLDPVFTLRFADEGTIDVTVEPVDEHGRFTLTEYTYDLNS
jgi:hypothetical protein